MRFQDTWEVCLCTLDVNDSKRYSIKLWRSMERGSSTCLTLSEAILILRNITEARFFDFSANVGPHESPLALVPI